MHVNVTQLQAPKLSVKTVRKGQQTEFGCLGNRISHDAPGGFP